MTAIALQFKNVKFENVSTEKNEEGKVTESRSTQTMNGEITLDYSALAAFFSKVKSKGK